MNTPVSRRSFLRGRSLRKEADVITPPGSGIADFYDLCSRCDECGAACPEEIIKADEDGWPVLQLSEASCTFCGDCARACPTGALDPLRVQDWPWRARVRTNCLSMNGISCRVCQDACEHSAIRFKLQLGGRSDPVLDTDACSGCGACVGACPADAVDLYRFSPTNSEAQP